MKRRGFLGGVLAAAVTPCIPQAKAIPLGDEDVPLQLKETGSGLVTFPGANISPSLEPKGSGYIVFRDAGGNSHKLLMAGPSEEKA